MTIETVGWAFALALAGSTALVIRGFLPVALRPDGSAVHHLSVGVILLLAALGARTIYWDALPVMLDWIEPGTWRAWHQQVGRPLPNMIVGLIVAAGIRHMLMLQWLLIPAPERARYSILTAPFYPRSICIVRGVHALRRKWRDDQ